MRHRRATRKYDLNEETQQKNLSKLDQARARGGRVRQDPNDLNAVIVEYPDEDGDYDGWGGHWETIKMDNEAP